MYKKRTQNVKTGQLCVQKVFEYCNNQNIVFQAEPREDFGVDCYLELEAEGFATNFMVGVQCKAGDSFKKSIKPDSFEIYISQSDKGYWFSSNIPIIFAYYDTKEDFLYFQHVQEALYGASISGETSKLLFTEEHKVDGDNLFVFLRELKDSTPTHLDRISVATTKEISWFVNEKPTSGIVEEVPNINDFVSKNEEYDCGVDYPYLSLILGYSRNREWVCTLETEMIGQKCGNVYGRLLNLKSWKRKEHILFSEQDYDQYMETMVSIEENQLEDRIAHFINDMEELEIEGAVTLYDTDLQRSIDYLSKDKISIMMNDIEFSLSTEQGIGLEKFVFSANKFTPSRRFEVLSRFTEPAPCIDGFSSISDVKYIDRIHSIHQSLDGEIISLSLITNPENGCWGSYDIHFVHVYKEQLVKSCVKSLL